MMSSNLSQEEISALLNKEGADEEALEGATAGEPTPNNPDQDISEGTVGALDEQVFDTADYLSNEEVDLLGEVGNICMGAVATTMYTLLNRRVSITTPRVHIYTTHDVLASYTTPYVVVEVEYINGVEGKNLLLMKEPDAIMITDLLMGGDGTVEEGTTINELHMSAISEIMNQMIGASATALSKMLNIVVNISPPRSTHVDINTDVNGMLDKTDLVIKICFDMEIEGLLQSQVLQLMPYEMGRDLASKLLAVQQTQRAEVEDRNMARAAAAQQAASPAPAPAPQPEQPAAAPATQADFPEPSTPESGNLVDVRHATYPSFDEPNGNGKSGNSGGGDGSGNKDLDRVSDIPLNVTVELGKTKKTISDVLDFGLGTVVVLDKMAGEHVEVLVNGKLIATGEVVVIDENYGVRITEIFNA